MMEENKFAEKILITGAGGMNGSAIIKEFERQQIPVTALVRNLSKLPPDKPKASITYTEGDMLHPDTLSGALDGVGGVLLMSTANLQMAETQCSFIDVCKVAGVRHIIKFSGEESGIGFDPKKFIFTRMHEEIEDYLEGSGLQWTHLRPNQFMEVYLREADSIKNKGILALPLGDITMSPVAVDDIAKIVVALLSEGGHEGESLRITGPQALSMAEIAAIIAGVTGNEVRYVGVSPEVRRQAMLTAGTPEYLADAIYQQTAERLRNPIARIDLSTHHLFGIMPTYFEEFAASHATAFGKADWSFIQKMRLS
jgi:uncharacterized protein YbjT (DUF2867 family)